MPKNRDARGTSCHLAITVNCQTYLNPNNLVNGLLKVRSRLFAGHMILFTKEVNASKIVTRMTKKGVGIRTDSIGIECLDELSRGGCCSG